MVMGTGRVIVVGSVNEDLTVSTERFPAPGETLEASTLSHRLGGKGANQAAAAAHAGADTVFIGRVGADTAGSALREELAGHGVDVSGLLVDPLVPTGTAVITVVASGENTILIIPGANGAVDAAQARAAVHLSSQDVVVLQGEVPATTNAGVIEWAHDAGARIVWNLAPVHPVDPELLHRVDVLVVNETEAGLVLGCPAPTSTDEALRTAAALLGRGPGAVLVTLGAAGAVRADAAECVHEPALTLGPVVDTTGAGDATVGYLAAALAAGMSFPRAVAAGLRAGSTAVLRQGAAASYTGLEPIR